MNKKTRAYVSQGILFILGICLFVPATDSSRGDELAFFLGMIGFGLCAWSFIWWINTFNDWDIGSM